MRVSDATDVESVTADFDVVTIDAADHVAEITIDRPDARNAMNGQVRTELKAALTAIEDSDVRVVVLTGSDESGAFVAGADVAEIHDRTALEQREAAKRPRVYEHVAGLRQPVIAAINGHALGGGCELAQACDVRIAREGAKLGQPEIDLGLIPGGGGTQRLVHLVGEGQAMRLILTGTIIDAAEADDIGLVDEVHPGDEFEERVDEITGAMATKSPATLEFAKTAVKAGTRMGLEDGIDYEAELFAQVCATDDSTEGVDAFLENRDPEWSGH